MVTEAALPADGNALRALPAGYVAAQLASLPTPRPPAAAMAPARAAQNRTQLTAVVEPIDAVTNAAHIRRAVVAAIAARTRRECHKCLEPWSLLSLLVVVELMPLLFLPRRCSSSNLPRAVVVAFAARTC